uniref:Chromatin modification-related protein YNG2 n=1 Tax=Clastoptera arizonana TaxID=38151 RepID=A0A1B6CBV2_9HEMI
MEDGDDNTKTRLTRETITDDVVSNPSDKKYSNNKKRIIRKRKARKEVNGEVEYIVSFDRKPNSENGDIEEEIHSQETNHTSEIVRITRKRSQINSDLVTENETNSVDTNNVTVPESSDKEFKGFKKRILAYAEKLNDVNNLETPEKTNPTKKTRIKHVPIKKNKVQSQENHNQQEYAQYLGLQPTVKFKCFRCSEKFQSMALLQGHQKVCGSFSPKTNSNSQPIPLSPVDANFSTNFRITRKVYLCSACGTYYENWNLFLHMRDVHKRHICLFCLGMFSVADKLAEHLMSKHSIHESKIDSCEEFSNIFKGSCYLMCCSCEKLFTERDDFFNHHCTDPAITALNVKCQLCGVKCGHFVTCPNNNAPCAATTSASSNSKSTSNTGNKNPNQTMAVNKYLVPVSKYISDKWAQSKEGGSSMEYDEDYDISDAASFCHVDIGDESGTHDKSEVGKSNTSGSKKTKKSEDFSETQEEICSKKLNEVNNPILVPIEDLRVIDLEKECLDGKDSESNVNECQSSIGDDVQSENNLEAVKKVILTDSQNQSPCATDKEQTEVTTNTFSEKTTENNSVPITKEDGKMVTSIETRESDLNVTNIASEDKEMEEDSKSDNNEDKNNEILDQCESRDEAIIDQKNKDVNKDISEEDIVDDSVNNEMKLDDISDSDEDSNNDADLEDKSNESDVSENFLDGNNKSKESDKKLVENGDKTDSESEDSDKLSLVVDDKVKNLSCDESSNDKYNKITNSECKNNRSFEKSNEILNQRFCDSTNSYKNNEDDSNSYNRSDNCPENNDNSIQDNEMNDDGIQVANDDIQAMALTLEDKLENLSAQSVIKECVRTSCTTCVYCSHAVKIAVNGKQLALHLLAEHRYTPIKNETTEDVIMKLKSSFTDLENVFFNTDSYDSSDTSLNVPHDQSYECFQCHFTTKSHKDLYNHKKKMHQKTILLCVMCKSNFYSYSELLCHMCPGIYVSEDITFRCCYCNLDRIPSAFRLMVHLRKSHHTCDICLDIPGDQQKLSTHMWKHKLHHLCYKCGIAYRNKPDITKHLFWKHGTESVLCKKCLQKKWPHVYHFCIPPTVFICEECNASFSRAVALKVHKRLHGGDVPYSCHQCELKFISKKLLNKHLETHKKENPHISDIVNTQTEDKSNNIQSSGDVLNVDNVSEHITKDPSSNETLLDEQNKSEAQGTKSHKKRKKDKDKKNKHVVDVYDLPPLNLSSESDVSDDDNTSVPRKSQSIEDESMSEKQNMDLIGTNKNSQQNEMMDDVEDASLPAPVVDGVWDNFHSYKAELEKREALDSSAVGSNLLDTPTAIEDKSKDEHNSKLEIEEKATALYNLVMADHDYCAVPKQSEEVKESPEQEGKMENPAPREHSSSIDHDYCSNNNTASVETKVQPADETPVQLQTELPPLEMPSPKKKMKTSKKKSNSSSDSSSDSDSSSCTCRSNCSCSSSSSNSSSSSSSDSESSSSEARQRAAVRREKRKEKSKPKQEEEINRVQTPVVEPQVEDEPIVDLPIEPVEISIHESDLDTDETLTDEDFYDQHPQRHANQLLAEKRNLIIASVAPVNNGRVSPPITQTFSEKNPVSTPPATTLPSPKSISPNYTTSSNPVITITKRKVKSKKRKKSQQFTKRSDKTTLPIYETQPSTSFPIKKSTNQSNINNSSISSPLPSSVPSFISEATPGSGSETESARLSKRKRVRNKFYGYSSEEEEEENSKQHGKWRKVDSTLFASTQPTTPVYNYQHPLPVQQPAEVHYEQKQSDSSASEGGEEEEEEEEEDEEEEEEDVVMPSKKAATASSNSSSSESESDNEVKTTQVMTTAEQTEKNDNLYCYCQCPYDEVSEMIACDGTDCTIEWFHFECVGIMVPPKGKWYCPDCRKRRESF